MIGEQSTHVAMNNEQLPTVFTPDAQPKQWINDKQEVMKEGSTFVWMQNGDLKPKASLSVSQDA